MSKYHQSTCKYGHLLSGENLLLRERTINPQVRKNGKVYSYKNITYTERVCRTCLNEQRHRYDLKRRSKEWNTPIQNNSVNHVTVLTEAMDAK